MSEQNLTHNQVDEQLAAGQEASVLVERHDGTVSVGQVMARGEHGARAFMEQDSEGNFLSTKILSSEKLSDDHQQKLAEELAGVALRGSEVAEVAAAPQRSWNQWVEDHPLSDADAAAIRQSVDKNIALTRMYGPIGGKPDPTKK